MENCWAALTRRRLCVAPPRSIAAAVILGLVLLPGRGVWAGTPTDEIRTFSARAVSIIEDPQMAPMERLGAVHAMLDDIFDLRGAAELALGRYWRARTPAERREFVPLFAAFLERSYLAQVKSRIKLGGGVKISYLAESADGNLATVRTTILTRGGRDVPFDYRMIRRGDRWAVRDVVIEGVSLVENYRAQFVKTIQRSSYPQLVMTMRAMISDVSATREADAGSLAPQPAPGGLRPEAAFKDAHFDPDGFAIGAAAAKILDENAAWLKVHGNASVLIEGHADERGTREVNLALGDRRARSAKAYLVAYGVQPSRITIVSHGDELPACAERTEACWARNRRVHFLVRPQ